MALKIINDEDIDINVTNIYRTDEKNIGDWYSSPIKYFDLGIKNRDYTNDLVTVKAAEAIKKSTASGDIVFKKVGEGGFIPIDISATLESFKIGEYDSLAEAFNAENRANTIYGVGLQATEGIMDLILESKI